MTCTETRASQVRFKQKHEWQTAWKLNVTEVEKLNVVKAAVEKKMKLFVTICIGRLSYDCAPVAIYGAGVEPLV